MTMYKKGVDIILGSTWLETLGTFIVNMKILKDIKINSDSKVASLEGFKDVSKEILQNNRKSVQKM